MQKKLKIKKSITRRFKLTKNGKLLHVSSFSGHLRRKKTKSQIRKFRTLKPLTGEKAKKIKQLMGY